MTAIKFFGGKLNNRIITIQNPLPAEYHNAVIKYAPLLNDPTQDPLDITAPILETEIYELRFARNGGGVERRCCYVKKGSKTKPETIWKYGVRR